MHRNLVGRLNNAPSFLVAYPLFMWFLIAQLIEKFPVIRAGWQAYEGFIYSQHNLIIWVFWGITATTVAMVGYLYFKAVFSNYWSSAVFFFLLFFIDLEMLAILLVSFLFLGLIDLVFSNPSNNKTDWVMRDQDPIDNFSQDFINGYITGVTYNDGSSVGAFMHHSRED